jgi:hypothetical protein
MIRLKAGRAKVARTRLEGSGVCRVGRSEAVTVASIIPGEVEVA